MPVYIWARNVWHAL